MLKKTTQYAICAAALGGIMLIYGCGIKTCTSVPTDRPTECEMEAYLTGYSYWDNTPQRSKVIAKPVIHDEAGGLGTYEDPITMAVGHKIIDGVQTLDFPEGTRFYLLQLKKYAIVEDVCGDGPTPQHGPCHIGHKGAPWLDIYIGAEASDPEMAKRCAREITGLQKLTIHPRSTRDTDPGSIFETVCSKKSRRKLPLIWQDDRARIFRLNGQR